MKDKFLTHKFLPMLALILFILFLFTINSFAITEEIYNTFPDEVFNQVKTFSEFSGTQYACFGFSYVNNSYRVIFIDRKAYPEFEVYYESGSKLGIRKASSFIYYDFNSSFSYTRNTATGTDFYEERFYGNACLFRNIKVPNIFDNVLDNDYFDIEIVPGVTNYDFVQAFSNEISSDFYNIYECYVSTDKENWSLMNRDYSRPDESKFNFWYYIYENNTYYFKLHNKQTGEDFVVEKVVDNLAFDIFFSTTDKTDKPIMAYSNEFPFDSFFVYISTDKQNWTAMNCEYIEYIPGQTAIEDSKERYFYYITKNGTYYFKFVECSAEEGVGNTFYITKEVMNLTVDDYMSDEYVPTPQIFLSFDEEDESFIIKTQNLLLDKALNMKCFYTSDPNNNNLATWNEMEIDFFDNTFLENNPEAYFYFKIPVLGAQDTDYRIAFYNYLSNKSSTVILYEFRYDKALDYVENDLKIELSFSVRLNNLLQYFKDRFRIFNVSF